VLQQRIQSRSAGPTYKATKSHSPQKEEGKKKILGWLNKSSQERSKVCRCYEVLRTKRKKEGTYRKGKNMNKFVESDGRVKRSWPYAKCKSPQGADHAALPGGCRRHRQKPTLQKERARDRGGRLGEMRAGIFALRGEKTTLLASQKGANAGRGVIVRKSSQRRKKGFDPVAVSKKGTRTAEGPTLME